MQRQAQTYPYGHSLPYTILYCPGQPSAQFAFVQEAMGKCANAFGRMPLGVHLLFRLRPPWLHSAEPSPGNPLSHERDPDRQGQFQSRRLFSSCVLSGLSGYSGFTGFVRHGFTRLSRLLEILCPTRGIRIGKANFSQGAYSLPAFCLGCLGILGCLGSLGLKAMRFLLGYLGILGLLFFSGHSV